MECLLVLVYPVLGDPLAAAPGERFVGGGLGESQSSNRASYLQEL